MHFNWTILDVYIACVFYNILHTPSSYSIMGIPAFMHVSTWTFVITSNMLYICYLRNKRGLVHNEAKWYVMRKILFSCTNRDSSNYESKTSLVKQGLERCSYTSDF